MDKKDKKTATTQLLEEAGLNSVYRNYIKRIDKGLLGANKQGDILSREGYSRAEKAFLDPQVSTCFLLLTFSIMKKDVVFEPIQEGKKRDINKSKELANFLNFSIKKLQDGGVRQLQFDLMTAKFFGWSLIEKVYDILSPEQSNKYQGYYYYKFMKAKRTGLWDFVYDDKDNVIGYRSLLQKEKVWSKKKFIRLSNLALFNNPNGTADFDKIWKFQDAKDEFIIFILTLGSRLQKGRQTILKGTNGGAYDKTEITQILKDLVENLSVYIPTGYEIDFSNFDVGALQHFLTVLRWLDSQIAIAMIGSSLAVNESQGAGTNAQSTVHMQNTFTFEEYLQGIICDALEESYMTDLIEWNFDTTQYPQEIWPTVKLILPDGTTDIEKIAIYEKLKSMQVIDTDTEIDLNYLREEFNLPDNPELFTKIEETQLENSNPDNLNIDNNKDNEVNQQVDTISSFYK